MEIQAPYGKPITIRDKKYLKWITTQPCWDCVGGGGQIVYSHQHLDIPEAGGGVAFKDIDPLALPKHSEEHSLEHNAHHHIRDKAEGVYTHMMRYKAELGDNRFVATVLAFRHWNIGSDRPLHDAIGFMIRTWE